MSDLYKKIPAVHRLVDQVEGDPRLNGASRQAITDAARALLDAFRAELDQHGDRADCPMMEEWVERVVQQITSQHAPQLPVVINATGIIIHTGLGRAPLAEKAVAAATDAAGSYVPVELDMTTGERGRRIDVVRELLVELTGAESAAVVNNGAAALMLALAALADDREVVVSRGELIEIGGSFRLPDVMALSGAKLIEVGTTNRTRPTDYERAIGEHTAALLKVHPSNYRVQGFTEETNIEQLVALGRYRGIPVIHDTGSGALIDPELYGLPGHEPWARHSVQSGADVVLFSGDKLLGGPQVGILVGTRHCIDRLERHPMMRSLRVDKIRLAALAATLQLHRDPQQARRTIPVLALASQSCEDLQARGRAILQRLQGSIDASVTDTMAYLGGGTLPTQAIPSVAIVIRPQTSEEAFAASLRNAGVLGRLKASELWLDLRTVLPEQDQLLAETLIRLA